MKGIDVSNNNGAIHWPSVARAGYEFAWAKASEGVTFKDSYLSSNLRLGSLSGVTMGAYHYARPDRFTARDEAQAFAQAYRPRPGDLLPVLDFEVSASKSPQAMSRWALDFLNEYERLTGVRPIIYTYPYFLSGKMNARMLKGELLWYADYSGVGGRFRQAYLRFTTGMVVVAHQYSSSGRVPGVSGRCDLDWASSKARIMKATVPVDHSGYWLWLQWTLGEGRFKGYKPFDHSVRPDVSKTIPKAWWKRRKKFVENRKEVS